jgi:hypothetical protein
MTLISLCLDGCAKSGDNLLDTSHRTWNLSGRTYFVGSTTQIGDVVLKCAGMTVTSGEDGSYQFNSVPEGNQTITAEKVDCDPYVQSVNVHSDTKCYVYLSPHTLRLWGHITNALDGPVQGAKVTLQGLVLYTNALGEYEFANLLRGNYTLSVTHPFYLPYESTVNVSSDNHNEILLKRELFLEGKITQDTYVDQASPNTIYWNSSALLLGQRAYDSTSHNYISAIRSIYISFSFPDLLADAHVSIVDAALQLFRYDQGPSITFNTSAIASSWYSTYVFFNLQPRQGASLFTASIAGIGYRTVLDANALNQLLATWRAKQPLYGIVITGGGDSPASFGSTESTLQPRLTFTVRY